MRSASLYRISGNSFVVAAVLWTISILLLPGAPAKTVAETMTRVGPLWITSGVLGIVGTVVAIVGTIGLYRHFAGGEQEGWVLLGAVTCVTGALLMVAAMVLAGVGMPIALDMAQTARLTTPEPAEAALLLSMSGFAVVGGTLMWLGLVPLGAGMLRDPVWPRAMAWGAVATGIVEAIAGFALMNVNVLQMIVTILGFAYLALLGNFLARLPRHAAAAAPAEQPGAPV